MNLDRPGPIIFINYDLGQTSMISNLNIENFFKFLILRRLYRSVFVCKLFTIELDQQINMMIWSRLNHRRGFCSGFRIPVFVPVYRIPFYYPRYYYI